MLDSGGASSLSFISYTSPEILEEEVTQKSFQADLIIAGLTEESLNSEELAQTLLSYEGVNDVLFVHSIEEIAID